MVHLYLSRTARYFRFIFCRKKVLTQGMKNEGANDKFNEFLSRVNIYDFFFYILTKRRYFPLSFKVISPIFKHNNLLK